MTTLATRAPLTLLVMTWLVAFNLRAGLMGLGPILPNLTADLALSHWQASILVAIPTALMGLGAVPGGWLADRWGARRVVLAGLVLTAAGSALRGSVGAFGPLVLMTLLFGAGIGMTQPSLPRLTRLWFPRRIGLATGSYATGLVSGATVAAAVTAPILLPLTADQSWRLPLVVWGGAALGTALLWAAVMRPWRADAAEDGAAVGALSGEVGRGPGEVAVSAGDTVRAASAGAVDQGRAGRGDAIVQGRAEHTDAGFQSRAEQGDAGLKPRAEQERSPLGTEDGGVAGDVRAGEMRASGPPSHDSRDAAGSGGGWSPWRERPLWLIALICGGQGLVYYLMISWLPTIYQEQGVGATRAGLLVGAFNLASLPSILFTPALADALGSRRLVAMGSSLLVIAGGLGLAVAPVAAGWLWLWGPLAAVGVSGLFGLALAMPAAVAPPGRTGIAAGMVLGVGFSISALGPLLAGALRDLTGSFQTAILILPVTGVALLIVAALLPPGISAPRPAAPTSVEPLPVSGT